MTHVGLWLCLDPNTIKPLCRICKRHLGEGERKGRVLARKEAGSHIWASRMARGNGFAYWLKQTCRRRQHMQKRARKT